MLNSLSQGLKRSRRSMDLHKCLAKARIAAAAGADILQEFRGRFSVSEKAPRDLVTEADLASQRIIMEILLKEFPDHNFIGEESSQGHGDLQGQASKPTWIVDPLDGTVNYIHGLQSYAVSIGLVHEGEIKLGVVHDPVANETYWAIIESGAFLGDKQIKCSTTSNLESALLACSFSTNAKRDSEEFERFAHVMGKPRAIRRLGSAALNLCYVAAGRLDGYWATSLKTWDVAAGALIAQEAGASISNIHGGDFDVWDPQMVVCGTANLLDQLIETMHQ